MQSMEAPARAAAILGTGSRSLGIGIKSARPMLVQTVLLALVEQGFTADA
jgi:hypothetical protein